VIGPSAKVVWRVRARDDVDHAAAFDALVVPSDPSVGARTANSQRLLGAAVPYEGELPDTPLTLVVRTRTDAGPLVVEYEAFGPDGSRQVYGRGFDPLVVIVRSTVGIVITGLPSAAPEPQAPAT